MTCTIYSSLAQGRASQHIAATRFIRESRDSKATANAGGVSASAIPYTRDQLYQSPPSVAPPVAGSAAAINAAEGVL